MKNIALFLFLLSCSINAQNNEGELRERQDSYVTLGLLKSFLPTPLARWNVGYIYHLDEKWKVGASIGYGSENILFNNYVGKDYRFWEIRPEIYYILTPNRKTIKYFSIETFYINQKEKIQDDIYHTEGIPGEYYHYDSADYYRQKFGATLNFGFLINFSNSIGLNPYLGLGFRTRINKFSNIVNPEIDKNYSEHLSPYHRYEGSRTGVELAIGIKFYYRIRN